MGIPTSGITGTVPSASSIGVLGFHVDRQDDVPGFNVKPENDALGFNLNEAVDQHETILSAPTPSPDVEEVHPPPPRFPNWVYDLVAVLPQVLTASVPPVGPDVAVNSPPILPSIEPPVAKRWPSLELPNQSVEANIGSLGGNTQSPGQQRVNQSPISKPVPQLRHDGWPSAQPRLPHPWRADANSRPMSLSPISESRPSEAITLANAPVAGGQQVQRQTSLQHRQHQTQQSSLLGAPTHGTDEPSLGQRLVQSGVDTIVPGAHYQRLARDQLRAGNYIGAGVYQGAALLDAGLGAATLGLSTRLAAGVRAAAAQALLCSDAPSTLAHSCGGIWGRLRLVCSGITS